MKIMFDAGHGGHDPGAVGLGGTKESNVALHIAGICVQRALLDGWTICATRSSDMFVSLQARAEAANKAGADVFISIHCNASDNREAHGYEAWTSPGQTDSDKLASDILRTMATAQPGEIARLDKSDGDGDKESKFYVLVHTSMPSVLVEVGFISHPETEGKMHDSKWLHAVADAIMQGLNAWKDKK